VRLSKLKLAGFKSFVDPTVVLTPGQLVGIVGPNGCGKSNLIDAVRWVLGESRASALRGESMQDVIFGGSTTRKPVSRASVELVFDNSDGRAAGQWSTYAEISVKRLVDRSGESEYFINGVKLRRKDVIDLFLGTGLGPRAYAIIEQGMISRVIEARPEDVRAFLEEAAGVTKYKERRRETEGRLADARENLTRVEDISTELTQQIDKLSAQAALAQRYQELSSALAQRQVLLWRFKHSQAGAELAALHQDVSQLVVAIDAATRELQETDRGIVLARERQQLLAEAVQSAQADFYAISAEVSRTESEIKSLREARARLTTRGQQLSADARHWETRETELRDEHAIWDERRQLALERLALLQDHTEASDAQVPEAEFRWRAARERLEAVRRELAQTEQRIRVEEATSAASARALESLALRRSRIESERLSLSPAAEEDLARLESEVAELSAQQHEAEQQLAQLQIDTLAAQSACARAQGEVDRRNAVPRAAGGDPSLARQVSWSG
jgi:chromosome segregation protein